MVLNVIKWNVLPGKAEAYAEWAQSAIPTILGQSGLVEFRGYRPVTGEHQIVVTYEFADLAAWAAWQENETIAGLVDELRQYATDLSVELWGPSPVVPQPIRPGG
jgi:heme-degrading monooxygenase HmoA